MYGDKKIFIEEIYISEKCSIQSLNIIFEEQIFWHLAYQTTWFKQEYNEKIPSIRPCGTTNIYWLKKNNVLDHFENDCQPGLCNKYIISMTKLHSSIIFVKELNKKA